MEYIKYQHYPMLPQYVFAGAYALRCSADGVSLSDVAPDYADPLRERSPFTGVDTDIYVLSTTYLAGLLLKAGFPLVARYEGPILGEIRQFSGYSAADMGTFSRKINFVELSMDISRSGVNVRISIQASPVLPETAHAEVRHADKQPMRRQFNLDIPHDALPAILNFDQEEMDAYSALLREVRD